MTKHLFIAIFGIVLSFGSCKEACKDIQCQNDGWCYEGECLCQKWYSGDDCALMYNRNYTGTYYGTMTFTGAAAMRTPDSLLLTADSEVPNRLITEFGFYVDINSDTSLIIPLQTVIDSNDNYTVEGKGKYDFNWIRVEYLKSFESLNGVDQTIIFVGEKTDD